MTTTLPLDTLPTAPPPGVQELAAELVDIKLQLDALEERRRLCQARLEACHLLLGTDHLAVAGFTITRSAGRRSYDYTGVPSVQAAADALKAAQDTAVATGAATLKPLTPFWSVRRDRD